MTTLELLKKDLEISENTIHLTIKNASDYRIDNIPLLSSNEVDSRVVITNTLANLPNLVKNFIKCLENKKIEAKIGCLYIQASHDYKKYEKKQLFSKYTVLDKKSKEAIGCLNPLMNPFQNLYDIIVISTPKVIKESDNPLKSIGNNFDSKSDLILNKEIDFLLDRLMPEAEVSLTFYIEELKIL
jgi:hypothetical protein